MKFFTIKELTKSTTA
jgi:zinc D-Ala-D-Ala carboxypeptidase